MSLTPEQLKARKAGIGASDAAKIVAGDWYELWLDKTGRSEPKAILSPWDAAVRHTLEPLIMDWYEQTQGVKLAHRGEAVICAEFPILRATLDGYDPQACKPIDAKALNVYTPKPLEWCVSHYAPQMQHQMVCMAAARAALYVSVGMKEPVLIEFEYDEFWAMDYVGKCQEFWSYVESDTAPPGAPVMVSAPVPAAKMRTVDMTDNNAWTVQAGKWLDNKKAAKTYEKAAKALKELVEADVGEAKGKGVIIKRAKNNALTIKADDDDPED